MGIVRDLFDLIQGKPALPDRGPAPPPPAPATLAPDAALAQFAAAIDGLGRAADEAAVQAAETLGQQALARLAEFRDGRLPFPPCTGTLNERYRAALWQALGAARRRRKYAAALCLWALLRATVTTADREIVWLAADVAAAFARDSSLWRPPLLWWAFGVALEAQAVVVSLPSELQAACDQLLEYLRIDWQPAAADQLRAKRDVIDRLLPAATTFANRWREPLTFWKALGQLRCDTGARPEAMRAQFDCLTNGAGGKPENRAIYFWYAARLAYEAAGDPLVKLQPAQLQAVRHALERWRQADGNAPPDEAAAPLANYFRALVVCERGLGLRPPPFTLEPAVVLSLQRYLGTRPAIVESHPLLRSHIAPVEEGLAARKAQLSPVPPPLPRQGSP